MKRTFLVILLFHIPFSYSFSQSEYIKDGGYGAAVNYSYSTTNNAIGRNVMVNIDIKGQTDIGLSVGRASLYTEEVFLTSIQSTDATISNFGIAASFIISKAEINSPSLGFALQIEYQYVTSSTTTILPNAFNPPNFVQLITLKSENNYSIITFGGIVYGMLPISYITIEPYFGVHCIRIGKSAVDVGYQLAFTPSLSCSIDILNNLILSIGFSHTFGTNNYEASNNWNCGLIYKIE